MDKWQTTVRGSTWIEINEAARKAIRAFFGEMKALEAMQVDIRPHTLVEDGKGNVAGVTYEADVVVKF